MRCEDKTESGKWSCDRQPMTKLQQAREAAQRAEQVAKEAVELVAKLEKEAESSVWVPEPSKEHFYIGSIGTVHSGVGNVGPLNSFPDRETAESVRDWLALMDRMRIAAGGYEWERSSHNYSLYCDFDNKVEIDYHIDIKYPGHIYFPSVKSAKDFIDSMTEHEKEVFKRGFPVY